MTTREYLKSLNIDPDATGFIRTDPNGTPIVKGEAGRLGEPYLVVDDNPEPGFDYSPPASNVVQLETARKLGAFAFIPNRTGYVHLLGR